jgi:hypothetical protein
VAPLTRARCSCGQTSAEYLGGLLLLLAIVTVFVTSGAGGKVAGGIHQAICFIAGEDCSSGGATGPEWGAGNAPPLSECVRNSSQRGIAGSVKVGWFEFGGGVEGVKEVRADGTTKVTIKANANAGLNFGAEVGISAGDTSTKVGSGASAKVNGSVARAWVFKSEAEADGFIDDVKKKVIAIADPRPNFPFTDDDADIKLPDYDEQTIQGGVEVRMKRGTGTSYLEGNFGASVGATYNTDTSSKDFGDKTYFFEMSAGLKQEAGLGDLSSADKLSIFSLARSGQGKLKFAITYDKDEQPKAFRVIGQVDVTGMGTFKQNVKDFQGKGAKALIDELTKRSVSANEGAGARVLLDAKLDLSDPANRAAVMGFMNGRDASGQPVSRLDSAVDVGGRLLTDSTFNVKAYTLTTDKKSVGFSAGVFGVSGEYTSENADLVAAYYRPAGDTFGFREWDACVSDEL